MILVTVGAQMPFDRLVQAVDAWAEATGRTGDVFAQIGEGGREPRHIPWTHFLEPDEFRRRLAEANVLVAHAGTGSIFSALEFGIPVLVLPRHADKNETRNDHQIATAKRFEALGHVRVAWDESEVGPALEALLSDAARSGCVAPHASSDLIAALADFVASA